MASNAVTADHLVIINHLLLKAVPKGGGREEKYLHYVMLTQVQNFGGCEELKDLIKKRLSEDITAKELIKKRLSEDITAKEFDVGYFEGSNIVRIRSKENLCEVWSKLQTNTKTTLWCDGLLANTEKGSSKGEASRAAKRKRFK